MTARSTLASRGAPAEVFVVGLAEEHRPVLRRLESHGGLRFHPLLRYEDVKGRDRYVLADLMAAAEAQLRAWPGEIDGIAAYWDFPAVSLAALLSHRHGTPAPSLAAVLACEHKYWSRLVQREVTAAIPAFALVDPFDIASLESAEVPLPSRSRPTPPSWRSG